jgi:hypothetical protein
VNKQSGGVLIALGGFVLLVGAFKGTWRQAWAALVHSGGSRAASTSTSATSTPSGFPGSPPPQQGQGAGSGPLAR